MTIAHVHSFFMYPQTKNKLCT